MDKKKLAEKLLKQLEANSDLTSEGKVNLFSQVIEDAYFEGYDMGWSDGKESAELDGEKYSRRYY